MEGSAKRSNAALLPRGQRPHSTRLSAAGLFAHRFARLVGGERERPEVGVPRLLNLDDVARGGLGVVVWYELAGVGLVSTDCTSSPKATPTPSADPEQGAPSRSGIWKHCLRNTGAEGGPRSEAWTTAGGWLLSAT